MDLISDITGYLKTFCSISAEAHQINIFFTVILIAFFSFRKKIMSKIFIDKLHAISTTKKFDIIFL